MRHEDEVTITIRPIRADDALSWIAMRGRLWPSSSADHEREVTSFVEGIQPGIDAVFVAESGDAIVGFAEVSKRVYAEGCRANPVGYLEGWFVDADFRRSGAGRALVSAAEDWSRAQGCLEFASDSDPENELALHAHIGVGFDDVGLVRCFRKSL